MTRKEKKSGWGGRREGAGRPVTKDVVQHRKRADLERRHPVHITLEVRREVGNLRSDKRFAQIKEAFCLGKDRFGMRLVEFSVQADQIQLIVEAESREALTRGMQGLSIRIARAVNRASQRRGKVFTERYRAGSLKTLAEVENAVQEMRRNRSAVHSSTAGDADMPVVVEPRTSLLKAASAD